MEQQTLPAKKLPFRMLDSNSNNMATTSNIDFRPLTYKSNAPVAQTPSPVAVIEKEQPKETVFFEKELSETRQKAYEEGYARGFNGAKSAEAEVEKIIQAILNDLTFKLAAINEAVKTRNNEHIKELMHLVITMARKVAGTALQNEPYAEIENILRLALPLLFDEPKINILVSPGLVDNINSKISSIAKAEGFKNNIEISGNPALTYGSCDIQWNGGGIRSNKDAIWSQIEKLCESL